MNKAFRIIIRLFSAVAAIIVIYLATVIIIGTITDYQPEKITPVLDTEGRNSKILADSTFTVLSWNIGFCGLGAEMDFFYDGGKMVRPETHLLEKYTKGVLDFLKSNDSIDFILLQEVDKNSSRTGKQDETELVKKTLPDHISSFGTNYKVWFVPLPFLNPLGKVEMGQMTLSGYHPKSADRYSYTSKYAWPKRLFMLDRCFIVSRFQMQNGKELVLFNTHNSAYDTDGKLRNIEMPQIRDLMLEEFKKGNYVVAGGDWNQNPPAYDISKVNKTFRAVNREILNRNLFPEDWQIVFNPENPTNREIDTPLTPGKTEVTIIDYYILSPNINIEQIKVLPMNFTYSDHEPVFLKIKLL